MQIDEFQIETTLKKLSSGLANESERLSEFFSKLLTIEQPHIIAFMNKWFFRSKYNLIAYLHESVKESTTAGQDLRKVIYEFVGDYIATFKHDLLDYLKNLFEKFYQLFKKEKLAKLKEKALNPLKAVIMNYEPQELSPQIINPQKTHEDLTNLIKITNPVPSIKGQLWQILSILQSKFPSQITAKRKREVQQISLQDLKTCVKEHKNFYTMASIIRGFTHSLNQNYLNNVDFQILFNHIIKIMIPLTQTYSQSIAALQLLHRQSLLFRPLIMKNMKDFQLRVDKNSIFQDLIALITQQNRDYKLALYEALGSVIEQIVASILGEVENPQMVQLFDSIASKMWDFLQAQTKIQTESSKNSYGGGSIVSIVKILGSLSPLILAIKGKRTLKGFFKRLLQKCERKVLRTFDMYENKSNKVSSDKYKMMKAILYNQKQLVSFLDTFAKIVEQLEEISQYQAIKLEQLFMVGVRQYPMFLPKYLPELVTAMVSFMMALSTKPLIFNRWIKKTILRSLMESLDAKRFDINNDKDYYKMIEKSANLWKELISHSQWHRIALVEFSNTLFDNVEHLILNLDVSYKTSLEIEMEGDEEMMEEKEEMDLVNVFFMSDETIQMSNIADYQYISGLALLFNELMFKVDNSLYCERVYSFYEQVIHRVKIFPKSIPLMKIIRSLNEYLMRVGWLKSENTDKKQADELIESLANFFRFANDNIFKYQENYFYEALKMLLSIPYQVYLYNDCQILKNYLLNVLIKSLDLGQEIISLANEGICCLNSIFQHARTQAEKYIADCIPYLEKFINFGRNGKEEEEEKEEVRSYLFLREIKIKKERLSEDVMKFLGSIGGLCHSLVANKTNDYISWDYHCKVDLDVLMAGQSFKISLTKLLSRTCWLMLNGSEKEKIVACEFIHGVIVYVIGKAANKSIESKENLSNFFDRILPTILEVASNTSHPSQQLIHTLLIQTIHFLANTYDPNSPDIQTLLRHLTHLYKGTEDSSYLASKCLSELVKWHIKQAPQGNNVNYPIINAVMKNIWSEVSIKKARNGIINFLIKYLKVIHRQEKIMCMYVLDLCYLIVILGRTDKPIESSLSYLTNKCILSIKPYVKNLILDVKRKGNPKISTLQKLLSWIYNNGLFSIYSQQRKISFTFWEQILNRYGESFDNSINKFLYERGDNKRRYLFSINKAQIINEDEPKLEKILPKITAYGEMWSIIREKEIFDPRNIPKFADFSEIYLKSVFNFLEYLTTTFINLHEKDRFLPFEVQKHFVECILMFLKNCDDFSIPRNEIEILQNKKYGKVSFIDILMKLLFRPNKVIPNFNFGLVEEEKKYQNINYHRIIAQFLNNYLGESFIQRLKKYFKQQFDQANQAKIVQFLFLESKFYDREIKVILESLSMVGQVADFNYEQFYTQLLKTSLKFTIDEFNEEERKEKFLSSQKHQMILKFVFSLIRRFQLIQHFLITLIEKNTIIYQKYEKYLLSVINNNWDLLGSKIINLTKGNIEFYQMLFLFSKMLQPDHMGKLFEEAQYSLIDIGLNSDDISETNFGNILKFNFILVQYYPRISAISRNYVLYLHQLVLKGIENKIVSKQTRYSLNLHEKCLNLGALLIEKTNLDFGEEQQIKDHDDFVDKFRYKLTELTQFYIPTMISQLSTSEARNKCSNFLKIFKSMVILSKNFMLIEILLSKLKDRNLDGYYLKLKEEIVIDCLVHCFQKQTKQKQTEYLNWMMKLFWSQHIDKDCWMNFRVIIVDEFLRKAIKLASQETIIEFFTSETPKIIDKILKANCPCKTIQELILAMELKRAGYQIIQELYAVLPKKEKGTEDIHKNQYHKAIIKIANQLLKTKPDPQFINMNMISNYDKELSEKHKNQILLSEKEKAEKKRPTGMEYFRSMCCAAYSCLIVLFISTQSNQNHFKTYIFESKGMLWGNILDLSKTDFNFEIQTGFEMMKPVEKINPKLKKIIKDKYWHSSLHAIEEEFVPASIIENLPVIPEDEEQPKIKENEEQIMLELDVVNTHPCMVSLLRVIDYLYGKFFDGNKPGWMSPIYAQLQNQECPLALRIFLTKLIINRPNIFTQLEWGEMLLKYMSLNENGGKFLHYYFRDTIKIFLTFIEKDFKPENIDDISNLISKIIRTLPHEDNMIYSDNIDVLENLLKIKDVFVNKKLINEMIKSISGENQKKKYDWRMCAVIVLKSCLLKQVPVLDVYTKDPKQRIQYFLDFSKNLPHIFQMIKETVKKYRVAASGFLGELLSFVFENSSQKLVAEKLLSEVVNFFRNNRVQSSNRNSRELFSVCLYHISLRFPRIVDDESFVYQETESNLVQFTKEQRNYVLKSLLLYCRYLIQLNILGKIPQLFITIRGYIQKIINDSADVQETLILLLNECAKQSVLMNKEIVETYSFIFDDLERVYGRSNQEQSVLYYYKTLISLKDFVNDPQIPKTQQINNLGLKVQKTLIKGLGSPFESVKNVIFQVFENPSKEYSHSAERLIQIFTVIYDPDHENLWLLNIVPLLFSLIKKSSDYTRLRFEESLGDLATYYDWDFRKNLRLQNSSQPYTPAFTLSTMVNQNKRMGTLQQSVVPSGAGERLRGMIKASQNMYMSQQEQVFTLLNSQSEMSSFGSLGQSNFMSSQQSNEGSPSEETGVQQNKINQIFQNSKRKRNRQIQQFKESNLNQFSAQIKVIDKTKIRFNKYYDKDSRYIKKIQQPVGESKGALLRKYKVGELPDIQITTKDLVDPMIYLSNNDYEFASELFIMMFTRICVSSRKDKKQRFKNLIQTLFSYSQKFDFHFISTLQKSLICLCQNEKESIDFSMKEIAQKSNTYDYAIVYTEENLIQTLNHPQIENQSGWKEKMRAQWGDLIDFYQYLNEDDLIYGVLLKITEGEEKKLLVKALQSKKSGKIAESYSTLMTCLMDNRDERIKDFIRKEKIDCEILMGEWENVTKEMNNRMQTNPLTIEEQKILTISLQNQKNELKESIFKNMNFHQSKCEYEKAIFSLMLERDIDQAKYHATTALRSFSREWKKISSFAFNSKHDLLQTVQKTYELQEFLHLCQKHQIKSSQFFDLFGTWSNREPNSIHDSNITWIQLLESRIMYSNIISSKFQIAEVEVIKETANWLIQVTNGMIDKGVFGGAEQMIRRALICKKQYPKFIWKFYDAIAKLKLKQFLLNKVTNLHDYQTVPKLIGNEMKKESQISELQKIKFVFLQNQFYEGYISSCLSFENKYLQPDFVSKIWTVYNNYDDNIKKTIKQAKFTESQAQVLEFKRNFYFKFTIFIEKMLSIIKGKFEIPEIKEAMEKRNFNAERLSQIFVEMLFTSIEISDFTNNTSQVHQQTVFSLVMKLLKIIQAFPNEVGDNFSEAISNKKLPIWIFLYFIPQIINHINNSVLAPHFEELFKFILHKYPEALVYPFNCAYETEEDCTTILCKELYHELHNKMQINFQFVQALEMLQHPEIRLKEIVQKFYIVGEKDNAIRELKKMISPNDLLGKYNKKFIEDWKTKIMRVINKAQSKDTSLKSDIDTILMNLDMKKKENAQNAAKMKDFNKISDGSLFFEDYNSNDWNRIEVPGTSYRRFEEPKPWNKVFVESFDHSLLTLISKQRPKRITVYGSNQKKYMLLVKAGEDIRLDQRIEELFDILNRIMKENSYCERKQLKIPRFEVTPMKKMLGVFEWIDQSQTLKDFLQIQFKVLKESTEVNLKENNGAFNRRCQLLQKLLPKSDKLSQHKPLQQAHRTEVVHAFKECERAIPYGLLRKALERLSKNYDSFLHIKNSFIANYAVICCVTYILGIGDRHLDNFLIHMSTANIVPIDFGFSFGAGINIGIPELIPFRLTKCFVELMDPIGFDGIFKKSMINSFSAFASKLPLITDYCEVFVDDPLLEWIWKNRKKIHRNATSSQSVSPSILERQHFTKKIQHVYLKLKGRNPRLLTEQALSASNHGRERYFDTLKNSIWSNSKNKEKELDIPQIVEELISLATDKNILGRTYVGWNPYV